MLNNLQIINVYILSFIISFFSFLFVLFFFFNFKEKKNLVTEMFSIVSFPDTEATKVVVSNTSLDFFCFLGCKPRKYTLLLCFIFFSFLSNQMDINA